MHVALRGLILPLLLAAPASAQLADDFEHPLDPTLWAPLRAHDVAEERLAVARGALEVGFDTLGTDDATVKVRGVISHTELELPCRVTVVFDWNHQSNGCYLSQGVALIHSSTESDPRAADTALGFEWVGVPPGRNVRPFLWLRAHGGTRPLYTEGWPQPNPADRVGRTPRRVEITLELGERLRLLEDGRLLFEDALPWEGPARLCLYARGHSNYPLRVVRFESVDVLPGER